MFFVFFYYFFSKDLDPGFMMSDIQRYQHVWLILIGSDVVTRAASLSGFLQNRIQCFLVPLE